MVKIKYITRDMFNNNIYYITVYNGNIVEDIVYDLKEEKMVEFLDVKTRDKIKPKLNYSNFDDLSSIIKERIVSLFF